MAAKKIDATGVTHAVPRRDLDISGSTIYDMYRPDYSASKTATSGATNLFDSSFYFMTSAYRVYKVLNNAVNGTAAAWSGTEGTPTSTSASPITAGNYTIKYMYTLSTTQVQNFLTPDFIPAPTAPESGIALVDGRLDTIVVTNVGASSGVGSSADVVVYNVPIRGDGAGGLASVTIGGTTDSSNTGQVKSVAVTANGTGYTHATILAADIKEQYISVKKIIIQINSLQRLCNIDYEHVIIDEIESLARYITSSHFMRNNNSSIIVSDLEYRIKESVKTIIMDADLSDRTINYCKKAMKLKRNNYYILKNKMMVFNNYTIKYTIYDNWVINILLKIKAKKKLVIPMASNNKAKDLQDLIKIKYPKTKVLLIHKETDDNSKLDILLNINTDWIKYDVVIYTPTVCMGVSFDVKDYFDYIFAYGCHESLGSQEFSQMIHRTRQPKNKTIYLAIDKYNYYNVEEERITREIAEEVICNDYYLSKYDIHNNLIPKKYGKDRILEYPYKDDVLYDLYLRNSIERIEDTNNFTASLFGYLKYKKYQIKYLKTDCEESTKKELKDIANKRKELELKILIKNILDAENLSEKDYNEKRLRKEEYMDEKT